MSGRAWMVIVVALSWAALAGGCGGGADDDDDDLGGDGDADADGDTDADGDGDCDPPDPPGATASRGQVRVTVEQGPAGGAGGRISAVFYESEPPALHVEAMREGDCRLLEVHPAQCEDFCNGICQDGECLPYPGQATAGDVTVSGLPGGDVQVEDAGGAMYYAYIDEASLQAGAPVTVNATGGEVAAFSLEGEQPEMLEADIEDDEVHLTNGEDTIVRWTPSETCGARIRLSLKTPTAAHGLPPNAIIECDVPDTGSLTVPSAIIDAFPETERAEFCVLVDCPLSVLSRYTRATSGAGAEEKELVVEGIQTFYVVHPTD